MSSSIERYLYAFKTSQKILNACQRSFYPIDIEDIILSCSTLQVIIMPEVTYKRYRSESNESRPYINIKDGRTYYDPSRDVYLIIYNDSRPKNRIRFTLAHEFAHIVFGHLSDERTEIDRGGLPDYVYFTFEGAANTFAGNFLAPPIIIAEKLKGKPLHPKSIASMFNISEQSARDYRIEDFNFWKTLSPSTEELSILKRYKRRLFTSSCGNCGYIQSIKGATYCQICGKQTSPLRAGDDETMGKKYPGIGLNKDGRILECPICKNESHIEGAKYCMVCGKPAINQCTFAMTDSEYVDRYVEQCQHREPLPGSARFCPYCGSKTTFFEQELLLPWDSVPVDIPWADIESEDGEIPF